MDPGLKLLQHIKTIPNLVNEDPSIITPENSTFTDLPWSDLSKLLLSTSKPAPSEKAENRDSMKDTKN